MSSEIFKVIASFETQDRKPLTGDEYSVRLCDEDKFFDDKLGTSRLDGAGRAEFLIFVADIISIDSPNERTPDLYFVIYENGDEFFRTETIHEVNFEARDAVTGRTKGLTKALGPFSVDS